MFYDAGRNQHGLRHDPFKALIVPRPIGWISTLSRNGIPNLAPYSFFNAVSTDPHMVMFSSAAGDYYGPLAMFAGLDMPASSALTQKWLGWTPTQIGLIADIGQPGYFAS